MTGDGDLDRIADGDRFTVRCVDCGDEIRSATGAGMQMLVEAHATTCKGVNRGGRP